MRDSDNLVHDAYELVNGTWTIRKTKWTYNTGIPIRAYVEDYRLRRDPSSLARARMLAEAAIDRGLRPLYDSRVADPKRNFWCDTTFFVQHLVADGLLELFRVSGDIRHWDEIRRHAHYLFWYIRDTDGMYFRNMRLWQIDQAHYKVWENLTLQSEPRLDDDSTRDASERAIADPSRTVKTLLANAAVARMFWKVALPPSWY